ncbi:MAG: 3-oxoacyl-[acyl-carrier-protein] reductase [Clostridiales bacterium]|nr:3-oxoacyl-[acyl-carrier-protein] reductase [Clostridiales bacterium]
MSKTALITGAGQGIGAAIAIRLANDGYNIAINCRTEEDIINSGNNIAEQCREKGVEAECFACDVSDYNACEEMVKAVKERFNTIDVLVNNAGITKDGLLARMSEEQYDTVINVNQKSVYNMMKHTSAVMIRQRSGKIINMASVAGLYGNAGQFNYSASKAAVIGMTLTAAKELGSRGITVNAIAPGFIETPMTDSLSDKVREAVLAAVPLKRYGKPEEVAATASFLSSDDASYITGQVIVVSGGMSM